MRVRWMVLRRYAFTVVAVAGMFVAATVLAVGPGNLRSVLTSDAGRGGQASPAASTASDCGERGDGRTHPTPTAFARQAASATKTAGDRAQASPSPTPHAGDRAHASASPASHASASPTPHEGDREHPSASPTPNRGDPDRDEDERHRCEPCPPVGYDGHPPAGDGDNDEDDCKPCPPATPADTCS